MTGRCPPPAALVKTIQSIRAMPAAASRVPGSPADDSVRIIGAAVTSAPASVSVSINSTDCARGRVTTRRRPINGFCSNHARESPWSTTSPTTRMPGGDSSAASIAAAIVSNVPVTVRWDPRVPFETTAAGVVAARLPASSRSATDDGLERAPRKSRPARSRQPADELSRPAAAWCERSITGTDRACQ